MENEMASPWSIKTIDKVCVVEFSPFNWSSSLMAIGMPEIITVVQCKFKEEFQDNEEDFSYKVLREFSLSARSIQAIAFSPETSLAVIPKVIKLATANSDNNIRILTSNLKNEDSTMVISGHSSYVNSITFEPESGKQLASTGDDHTCRIWDLDGTAKACFALRSAGMAVSWHKDDVGKIMVAQKNGVIRFYNVNSQQPIMSIECGQSPLMSAEWCPGNHLKVVAVADCKWFVWDITRSSYPLDSNQAHTEGVRNVRWSQFNQNVFVTTGRPGNEIKVLHYKQNQVILSKKLKVGSGISWHNKLGVLAAVGDKQVHLFKLDVL